MKPHGRRGGRPDQRERERLAPIVESGQAVCRRCGQPITPGQPWDAGHIADLAAGGPPDGPVTPEHASCNRSAGAMLSNERQRQRRSRLRPSFFGGPGARGTRPHPLILPQGGGPVPKF